jgi:hypothetical protein
LGFLFVAALASISIAERNSYGVAADSDEAGHAFQIDAGHPFRSETGHGSDLKPATWR